MNINAGTNQYNLSLKKMKEEKRPTFATIFDKLDARSKKLNPKNPLNAVMTNEQMYRYYLEETEPMLREAPDDYDLLDDVIGGKSLKDMKLSEFAKLLSGELESNRNVKYETLTATITPTPAAPIVPSSITITTPPSAPAPPPSAPAVPPATPAPAPALPPPATPAPAPAAAPAPPPSGSSGTGTAAAPSGGGGGSGTGTAAAAPPAAPAAAPAAPVAPPSSAPPAGSGLSVSIPPAGSGSGSTPTGSTAGGVISGIASAASGLLSSAKSLLSSPKPPTGGPSGTSVPSSAVASAATTAPATGVPTATPASGAATPAGGGAAGAVVDTGGYTDRDRISAFSRAIAAGLPAPRIPVSTTKTISQDENMIKYAIELSKYNTGLTDKKYSIKPTTAIGKIITTYERLNKRGASEEDIIIEIKKGK
jgi:hypothetical protein